MRRRNGFSMVELLIVIAIILIIAGMYMGVLSRARSKAMQVVAVEAARQSYIGKLAKGANIARPQRETYGRGECRRAYRQTLQTGSGDALVTELLYEVRTEAEFRAYWHTLINPDASGSLEFERGALVARDEDGNEHVLGPLELDRTRGKSFPIGWEFLSSDMSEMSSGSIGANVMYSDGHVEYIAYPGRYPVCSTVAALSHRFVQASS